MLLAPMDSSIASILIFSAQWVGFVVVFIAAFRHNRFAYRDSYAKATLWALALAAIWPFTLVVWLFARRRYSTPLSPHA